MKVWVSCPDAGPNGCGMRAAWKVDATYVKDTLVLDAHWANCPICGKPGNVKEEKA